MNRRHFFGRLAAVLGAGMAAPQVLAAEQASEHLAAAEAWERFAAIQRGMMKAAEGEINIYLSGQGVMNPQLQRAILWDHAACA